MQVVVAKPVADIMKEGTASDSYVATFVQRNVWASDAALEAKAGHMDRLEDNIDADALDAAPTGETAVGEGDDADAATGGGDTDISDGDDAPPTHMAPMVMAATMRGYSPSKCS
jgi:hypothetical protein